MTRFITIILLFLCLISFGLTYSDKSKGHLETNGISFDSSLIAILPYDTSQNWIFKECKQTNLSTSDIENIEAILKKCIDNYNRQQEQDLKRINSNRTDKLDKKDFIIELKRYKRQYISVIDSKGAKEVWINCFCNTWDKNWRKSLIFVFDGGNCYFNLKINLTTGEYYDLMVNGDA